MEAHALNLEHFVDKFPQVHALGDHIAAERPGLPPIFPQCFAQPFILASGMEEG